MTNKKQEIKDTNVTQAEEKYLTILQKNLMPDDAWAKTSLIIYEFVTHDNQIVGTGDIVQLDKGDDSQIVHIWHFEDSRVYGGRLYWFMWKGRWEHVNLGTFEPWDMFWAYVDWKSHKHKTTFVHIEDYIKHCV